MTLDAAKSWELLEKAELVCDAEAAEAALTRVAEEITGEIHDMTPLDETGIEASTDQVQFVLEVNQGWFKRHKIKVGTLVVTEKGPLKQYFFRR